MASQYKDGLAMIDNIIDGKALPEHLARTRAGQILPKSRTQAETRHDELRRANDALAKEAGERINKAPLLAICFAHTCACGNSWQSFGFYARKTTMRVPGAADATFTKRLDYDPRPEPIGETEWQTVEEHACIKCFGGTVPTLAQEQPGRVGGIARLHELTSMARTSLSE
jgi:hypothetical protein